MFCRIFDLVNVHLIHDVSNIAAMETVTTFNLEFFTCHIHTWHNFFGYYTSDLISEVVALIWWKVLYILSLGNVPDDLVIFRLSFQWVTL